MNYIKHINNIMQMFYEDDDLIPTHVSLYMALFQVWNHNRFKNPIYIHRNEIMKMAKIHSLTTYTKCIRELQKWQYIDYQPSHNPITGTKINMYNFCTTNCTTKCTTHCTTSTTETVQQPVQLTVQLPYIKKINITNTNKERKRNTHTKNEIKLEQISKKNTETELEKSNIPNAIIKEKKQTDPAKKIPPSLGDVFAFFEEKKITPGGAEKFFNYFESNGWKVGGKAPMKDWQAAAKNWILNETKFNHHETTKSISTTTAKSGHLHSNTDKDYDEPL